MVQLSRVNFMHKFFYFYFIKSNFCFHCFDFAVLYAGKGNANFLTQRVHVATENTYINRSI